MLARRGACNIDQRRLGVAELISAYPPGIWLILLATGLVIGVLAGLLGVGGGVIAVPILLEVFDALGMAEAPAISLAVGTAQATILVTSLTAATAHWRADTIDWSLVRNWMPSLIVGIAVGLILASCAPVNLLTSLFAAAAAGLALKMAIGDRLVITRTPPIGVLSHIAPIAVGGLAAAVGVGGGTLSTPVLTLFSFPLKRAIGAGALFNLVISLPATIVFLNADHQAEGRPVDALGDVALFCVAALSIPALFVAPAAAGWSTRAPVALLRRLFALCLAAIAARMVFR